MFLLDLFKKRAKGRTPYEWFEQMILGILVFIIAMIIIYTLILAIITLVNDFRSGITFMETAALQDTFGLILTVIILVEFNHSIVLAIRLARKLVLLDYAAASVETLLGLGGLALSLGGLYWLISDGEQRRRTPDSIVR